MVNVAESGGGGGGEIIGTSPTTGEVLVKDSSGNMSWRPGTPDQVQKATDIINSTGERPGMTYTPPSTQSSSSEGTKSPSSVGMARNSESVQASGGAQPVSTQSTPESSTPAPQPSAAPQFGTPEYTEWYYNNPSGPGYNPNNKVVDVDSNGDINVVDTVTGEITKAGTVTTPEVDEVADDGVIAVIPPPTPEQAAEIIKAVEEGKTGLLGIAQSQGRISSEDATRLAEADIQEGRPVEIVGASPTTNEVIVKTESGVMAYVKVTDPNMVKQQATLVELREAGVADKAGNIDLAGAASVIGADRLRDEFGVSPSDIEAAINDRNANMEAVAALRELENYKVKVGAGGSREPGGNYSYGYDINTYLKEAESPGKALTTLRKAGFSDEAIQRAARENNEAAAEARRVVEEQYSAANVAKYAGGLVADMLIPGYYTVRNWNNMGAGEKAFSITMDVITIIPFLKAAGVGARAVSTSGRVARLAGAAKGVGREMVSQAVAPVTMIAHPVATVKSTVNTVRDLSETLLHPKKLPSAVITTSDGTVRLRVTEATTPKEAEKIRDTLMELSLKGEKPLVEVNGVKYELSRSPLMKELGGGLAHATPDIEILEGAEVKLKEGMPAKEQGWFLANEPAAGFTESSAFGKGSIPVPAGASGKVVDISKYRPAELVQIDKAPVRSLNLADAKNIPADLSGKILDYAKKNNAILYGSFNEWLKIDKAMPPNDFDFVFSNATKAKNDLEAIAKKAGYETRQVPHGIEIKRNGQWVKIGDVASPSQHKAMLDMPAVTNKISGLRVETLGKQYIGQAYGAVAMDAKAATRAKKLEKAASAVIEMVQKAGISKKKPGIFIISPESAKKTRSSKKLYNAWDDGPVAEMERILPVGEKIPTPKQRLFTRLGPTGERVEIWLEKPLSKVQIAKLKALGAIEDAKAAFKPAITVSGKNAALTADNWDDLASILRSSGNTRTYNNLMRYRAVMLGKAARVIPEATRDYYDQLRGVRVGRTITSPSRSYRPGGSTAFAGRVSSRTGDSRRGGSNSGVAEVRQPRAGGSGRDGGTRPGESRGGEPRTGGPRGDGRTTVPPRTPRPTTPIRTPEHPRTPRHPDTPRTPDSPRNPRTPDVPRVPKTTGGKQVVMQMATSEGGKASSIPDGSIAWKQGMFWKFIPPPYNQDKPITLNKGVVPVGARFTNGRTPQGTVQIIGKPGAQIPEIISVDTGVSDVFIYKGNKIEFKGEGLKTDVGKRISSTLTGMSFDESPTIVEDVELFSKPSKSVHRTTKTKKKSRRTPDYASVTTLRGFKL